LLVVLVSVRLALTRVAQSHKAAVDVQRLLLTGVQNVGGILSITAWAVNSPHVSWRLSESNDAECTSTERNSTKQSPREMLVPFSLTSRTSLTGAHSLSTA
jgi:hypothetical protein